MSTLRKQERIRAHNQLQSWTKLAEAYEFRAFFTNVLTCKRVKIFHPPLPLLNVVSWGLRFARLSFRNTTAIEKLNCCAYISGNLPGVSTVLSKMVVVYSHRPKLLGCFPYKVLSPLKFACILVDTCVFLTILLFQGRSWVCTEATLTIFLVMAPVEHREGKRINFNTYIQLQLT